MTYSQMNNPHEPEDDGEPRGGFSKAKRHINVSTDVSWYSLGKDELAAEQSEYLTARGIKPAYWQLARYRAVTDKSVCRAMAKVDGQYSGLLIPYFKLDGTLRPDDFVRMRLIGQKTEPKFKQPNRTANHLYFAPIPAKFKRDWRVIAQDLSMPIYVVEGEIKAAALAQHGYPAIGIGGVWNWLTKKADKDSDESRPLPDFGLVEWRGRKVTLAFDHDALIKPKLRPAIDRLARLLWAD